MSNGIVRLQVEVDRALMNELENLLKLGGLRTKKEIFNIAAALLQWAAKEKARGNAIGSLNETNGRFKELQIPFLESIAALHQDIRDAQREDSVQSTG